MIFHDESAGNIFVSPGKIIVCPIFHEIVLKNQTFDFFEFGSVQIDFQLRPERGTSRLDLQKGQVKRALSA